MRILRAVTLPAVMLASLLIFATAFADASGATSTPAGAPFDLPAGWPGVVMVALVGASWLLRKATRATTGKVAAFIHSTWGAALSGFFSGAIPMVMQIVQTKGLDGKAIMTALEGALLAYWAVDNASNTSQEQQVKVLAKRVASPPNPPTPPIDKAAIILPLAFALFAIAGCKHLTPSQRAYGNAFSACMEQKGLSVAPGVADEVWNDLTHGTNIQAVEGQLEQLATKAGTDAVACAAQAWLGPVQAKRAELNPVGVSAANGFLKRHWQQTSIHFETVPVEKIRVVGQAEFMAGQPIKLGKLDKLTHASRLSVGSSSTGKALYEIDAEGRFHVQAKADEIARGTAKIILDMQKQIDALQKEVNDLKNPKPVALPPQRNDLGQHI